MHLGGTIPARKRIKSRSSSSSSLKKQAPKLLFPGGLKGALFGRLSTCFGKAISLKRALLKTKLYKAVRGFEIVNPLTQRQT